MVESGTNLIPELKAWYRFFRLPVFNVELKKQLLLLKFKKGRYESGPGPAMVIQITAIDQYRDESLTNFTSNLRRTFTSTSFL